MKTISTDELEAYRAQSSTGAVIDVRLEEDFAVAHIPGAQNVSVFNVSFLADLGNLGTSKDTPVVVYGAGPESHESRMAAEKLNRAGYKDVREFRGGMEAWRAAGKPTEGSGHRRPADPLNGTFSLDLEESRVEWLGRNLMNKHFGTVPILSGHVACREGKLVGGDFTIDLTRITCADISDSRMNGVLIDHLRSDDFFDVDRHPRARFQIRKVEAVNQVGRGLPDVRVSGDLTLRGQVNPLVLFAVTGVNSDGRFCAQAVFGFDRTIWGSIYGSGRYFKNVGMHLVNDLVEIQVRLVT